MKLTESTKSYTSKNSAQKWVLIDANNKTLGRLATKIADIIRGKNKAIFSPNSDCGDYVVVINAKNIKLTGKKLQDKMYYTDSRYIGGLKQTNAQNILQDKPTELLYLAVKGMLPKTKLSHAIIKKLKIYEGSEHPHTAQTPVNIEEQ